MLIQLDMFASSFVHSEIGRLGSAIGQLHLQIVAMPQAHTREYHFLLRFV